MTTKKKYTGQLLIANPSNPKDELDQSVLLLVTHTDNICVGLQINNPHVDLTLDRISENLGIELNSPVPVYYGGNISQNKIHIIHSLDWEGMSTVKLTDDIGITNDISVLTALARGEGPKYFRACSGYWLWEDGRLDQQLNPNSKVEREPHKWEIAPATIFNVFKTSPSRQWERAIDDAVKHKTAELF